MASVSVPQEALFGLGFFYGRIQKEGSRTNSFLKEGSFLSGSLPCRQQTTGKHKSKETQKEGSRTNSFLIKEGSVFVSSVQIDSRQRVSTSQKKYKWKVPEQKAS